MAKKFIVFLALVAVALSLSLKFQENVGKSVKAKVQKALQEKTIFEDLKGNFYNFASLKYLKTETKDLKVCEALSASKQDLKSSDSFFFYKLAKEAGCSQITPSPEKSKAIQSSVNLDDLESFYSESLIGFLFNSYDKSQTKAVCSKNLEFLEANGAAKVSKKKNADSSYEDSHKVLNIALWCLEADVESEGVKAALKKAIPSIYLNSVQINKEVRAIYDGKSPISTTASLLYYVRKLSKYVEVEEFANGIPEFLNFLSEAALGTTCPKGVYSIYRALDAFQDFPLVSLDPRPVPSKKSAVVLNVRNVYGEQVEKLPKIQGQLSLNGKKIGGLVTFEGKNGRLQGDLDTSGLTELRFYELQVTVGVAPSLSYTVTKSIGITTKVSVQNFRFEVVQSKVAPKILSTEVASGQTFKETVAANQNSFIHIQFELKFDDKKAVPIKQIAVKLKHPEQKYSTNLVNAVYDGTNHIYKAVIDLGDPDHVMAFNALYKAELIIADELLLDNIRWNFANFEVTFSKPLKNLPARDVDYTPLPLIAHKFPSPRKAPPSFITLTFCGAIIAVVLLFLVLLSGISVNFSKFPTDFRGAFFSIVFTLVIFAHVGVLCLFWVKINLIQTLAVLCLMFIPTILIGNESLTALNWEQEVGPAKEIVE